ncbi:hypothetical protein Tco_0861796 [Tanacetum coccineum]
MSTLAECMIVTGADNCPPMLEKPQYESWKSRMELYIQGKDHGRIILNSVENDPLVWPTVEQEDGTVFYRMSTLSSVIMQGTSLSRQERDCKLYDEFDKFSSSPHVKSKTVSVLLAFLNSLPPEWGKFVTNVKLATDLHTSNYDQIYAYLEQHETSWSCAVLTFLPGDEPIAYMNKAMAFLSAVFTPRYPPTNNQLRSSSNPRNQAIVQDGRVTIQQVQGRQGQNVVGSGSQGNASGSQGNTTDPGVADGQVAQTFTHNAAFQTDDLDAYDFDCDDMSSSKAVLMANLSSCSSDVLSEVPYSDTFQNDTMNQSRQELQYSKKTPIVDYPDNEIMSDSNIIPYSQYREETQQAIDKANNETKIVNESLTAKLERYKERVKILEQRFNVDLSGREKFIDLQIDDMIRIKNTKFAAFETEIDTLK